jgi:hypothetical protein
MVEKKGVCIRSLLAVEYKSKSELLESYLFAFREVLLGMIELFEIYDDILNIKKRKEKKTMSLS